MDDEADLLRREVQEHLTVTVSTEIEIGKCRAIVTSNKDADGYYIVQWTSHPFTCQETGKMRCCCGKYLNLPNGIPKVIYQMSIDLSTLFWPTWLWKQYLSRIHSQIHVPKQ
jgi:hypothetical protein